MPSPTEKPLRMLRKWGSVVFSILTFLSTLAASSPDFSNSGDQVPLQLEFKEESNLYRRITQS